MAANVVSHDVLLGSLNYCKSTGGFTRKSNNTRQKAGDVAGSINKSDGYRYIRVCGKRYAAHKLAIYYVSGTYPICEIDHINHNRSDNSLDNLRLATRKENSKNLKLRKDSTTGAVGVSLDKRNGKYKSYICIDSKYVHLGNFASKEEAAYARNAASCMHEFHINHGEK